MTSTSLREIGKGRLLLVMLALATGLTAAVACGRTDAYTPPPATFFLEAAPLAVDAFSVYDEWLANPDACQAKYSGQKLYCQVEVKRMSSPGQPAGADSFVQLGPIKFLVAVPDDLKNVHVGSKVQVVGTLTGLQDYTLIFSDCWVRIINPQLTVGY
jgi:hypothetical protein